MSGSHGCGTGLKVCGTTFTVSVLAVSTEYYLLLSNPVNVCRQILTVIMSENL